MYHLKEMEQNKNCRNLADVCGNGMTSENGNLSGRAWAKQYVSLKTSVISLQVLGALLGQVLRTQMVLPPSHCVLADNVLL